MKMLIQKTEYVRSINSKVFMALIFASAISVLSISSALADRDDEHGGRGHYHGHGYQREYQQPYGYGNRQPYGYPQGYQQPYAYMQPVYVPPPVYYVPQQPPGISLVFPLNFYR